MRMRTLSPAFTVLGLSLFLAAGCDTTMEPSPPPAVEAFLNVPFSLSAGQTAVLADEHLAVTFVGVVEDGRCPVGWVCIVPGNATMSVQAALEGKAPMTLNLLLIGDPGVYDGFGIHVQQLMPDKEADRTIRPEDYSVRLLVDRA